MTQKPIWMMSSQQRWFSQIRILIGICKCVGLTCKNLLHSVSQPAIHYFSLHWVCVCTLLWSHCLLGIYK